MSLLNDCKEDIQIFLTHKEVIKNTFMKTLADTDLPVLERWKLFERYAHDILEADTWFVSVPDWWSNNFDLNRYQNIDFVDALELMSDLEDVFNTEAIEYDDSHQITKVPDEIAVELEKIMKLGVCSTVYDW